MEIAVFTNLEVFVSHRNARLTFHARRLLVHRVRVDGMPVAHVAKAMRVSRQCAHRWVARFDAEGDAGLYDRSSRPHRSPTRTSSDIAQQVVALRRAHRRGPDWIAAEVGISPRTVTRILNRYQIPKLAALDPLTGTVIRATKTTAVRYERDRPGDLMHMDVKKIGRIPDGGGWRAWGRQHAKTYAQQKARIGYDYVHSIVDDHSLFAYTEILDDAKGDTCAGFLTRVATFFASHGITDIHQIMTDNHYSHTKSHAVAAVIAQLGAEHITIRPHCPWQNGKVERFNQTLQTEWAYRQVFTTNDTRTQALQPRLEYYNHQRRHHALGGQPPVTRLTPTSVSSITSHAAGRASAARARDMLTPRRPHWSSRPRSPNTAQEHTLPRLSPIGTYGWAERAEQTAPDAGYERSKKSCLP